MNLWKFILNRATHHWQIYFTLILGVVFATSLLASAPLIENTVLNLSIPYKLQNSELSKSNLLLNAYEQFSSDEYNVFNENIQALIARYLGNYISAIIPGGISGYTYPWIDSTLNDDNRISLGYYQDLEKYTHLIDGEWPTQYITENNEIRVVIGDVLAQDYQLQVGDILPTNYSLKENSATLLLYVAGIISPKDPDDAYWSGNYNPLINHRDARWSSSYITFVNEDVFFELDERYFSNYRSEYFWNVIFDPNKITFNQINPLISQLNSLHLEMADVIPKVNFSTSIINILENINSRSRIVRVTIYIFITEVLFLAAFYITMISTLFSEFLNSEFSNLSSRGSSTSNILGIQFVETLFICGIALIIGILTAVIMVWCISEFGPISDLIQTKSNIRISYISVILASIGILICIVSLLNPVRRALKRSIVIHSREIGRNDKPPLWQRMYLDVVLLFIGLIFLLRFYIAGGISAVERSGSIDWLLLITPIILLVSAAVILNRFFPIVVNGLCGWLARGRSFSTTLSLYYISRNPNKVTRLVFMLILAMSLGVLATGMNATLDATEYERALYAVGSSVRLEFDQLSPGMKINNFDDDNLSSVYRSDGSLNIRAYHVFPSFDFIAIDPYTLIKVTKFRSDYALNPMEEVLGHLVVTPSDYEYSVVNLPGEPVAIGIWISNDTIFYLDSTFIELIALRGKFITAKGEVFLVDLKNSYTNDNESATLSQSDEDEKQWYYFEGNFPSLDSRSYPISLHSLWFNVRSTTNQYSPISLLIDDISLKFPNTEIEIIEDFELIKNIWQVNNTQADVIFARRENAHSGTGSLILHMPPFRTSAWGVGLSVSSSQIKNEIPVLASEEFLRLTDLVIGDKFIGYIDSELIPMIVAERIQYFPTMYDRPDKGFLILPRDPIITYLNQKNIKPVNVNEIWLNTDNADVFNNIGEQHQGSVRMLEISDVRKLIKADPLSLGLRSVIIISFWISAILCTFGFNSYFYVNTRSRETQFGVLRSIGMSIKQLYTMLFSEQVLIIFFGLSIGLVLGLFLNMIILPGLPIALSEQPPIPPFLPYMDWVSIVKLYAIMMVASIVVLGITTLYLWKSEIHAVLRIGIE